MCSNASNGVIFVRSNMAEQTIMHDENLSVVWVMAPVKHFEIRQIKCPNVTIPHNYIS